MQWTDGHSLSEKCSSVQNVPHPPRYAFPLSTGTWEGSKHTILPNKSVGNKSSYLITLPLSLRAKILGQVGIHTTCFFLCILARLLVAAMIWTIYLSTINNTTVMWWAIPMHDFSFTYRAMILWIVSLLWGKVHKSNIQHCFCVRFNVVSHRSARWATAARPGHTLEVCGAPWLHKL